MQQYRKNLGKVSLTAEGAWNLNNSYDILSIVYDEHTQHGFISRKAVPQGVDLYNKEYWMPLNVSGYVDNNVIILSKKTSDASIQSYTLEEAIASIKSVGRRPGAILGFYNENNDRLDIGGRWELWQFNDTNIYNWENVDSWQNLYYNYNKFMGWFKDENFLTKYAPFPEIGCYAFVGSEFNEATVYRCDNKYVWKNTTQHAWDYVKVVVDGNVTVGENGNWFNNGEDTGIPASVKGENGKTPVFREKDNTIQYSFDNINWITISDKVAAWFRWNATTGDTQANNVGRIQISRDNVTWTNLSGDIINNLHISRYIGADESLPTSGIAEGTIYAKGPTYADGDTSHANPIYRLWVYAWKDNTLAWQDNGEFTSIAAGVVQETGDSETEVMSQKAVSTKLSELGSKLGSSLTDKYLGITPIEWVDGYCVMLEDTQIDLTSLVKNDKYRCAVLPANEGDLFYIHATSGNPGVYRFFDSAYNPLSGITNNSTVKQLATAPANTAYIAINDNMKNGNNCFIGLSRIDKLEDASLKEYFGIEVCDVWIMGSLLDLMQDFVNFENPTPYISYRHIVIPCTQGDVFYVSSSAGNPRVWAFVKSDGTITRRSSSGIINTLVTTQSDEAYLIVNSNKINGGKVYKCNNDRLLSLENDVIPIKSILPKLDEDVQFAVNMAGEPPELSYTYSAEEVNYTNIYYGNGKDSENDYCVSTPFIAVHTKETISFNTPIKTFKWDDGLERKVVCRIFFYDKDKKFLSYWGTWSPSAAKNISIKSRTGCAYIRFTLYLNYDNTYEGNQTARDVWQDNWLGYAMYGESSGAYRYAEINSGESNDIISLNNRKDTINKLSQLNRSPRETSVELSPKPLVMLHFSDIHSDQKALERIMKYYTEYQSYIDDIVSSGDQVGNNWDNTMDFWNNAMAQKVLMCIGNHEVEMGATSGIIPSPLETYNKYIAPYISNWGVVSPIDASVVGKSYYYKDYELAKVRLIVVDCMRYDTAQKSWLEDTLEDARVNDYGVVIMSHYRSSADFVGFDCSWQTLQTPHNASLGSTHDSVDDFIVKGGEFICYIAGHTHLDMVCKDYKYNNQINIVIDTASIGQSGYSDIQRVQNTRSMDLFNVFSVDRYHKCIKIIRVGANRDSWIRGRNSICINYASNKIIYVD